MTEIGNHERVFFLIFVSVRTTEGTTSNSLVYLFRSYVFYWREGDGDNLRGQ